METFFLFIISGFIFWLFIVRAENNQKIEKQKNKERSVQRVARKKLQVKNDKMFVGVYEGYVREKIDFELRKAVLIQDDVCLYCGNSAYDPVRDFQIDHFIPVTRGGTNAISNLFPSCEACNSEKSNNNPFDYMMYKYLRKKTITPKSLELLKGMANQSLEFQVNTANQE